MPKKKKEEASNPNKLSGKEFFAKYWFWFVIMGILLIVGAWAGFVVEDVGKISKVIKKPEKYINEYLEAKYFLQALSSFLSFESKAFIGGVAGAFIGFVIFAMAAKPKKRFHRKGVEHGSARWGNDKEKELIEDANDFYNNVILSGDVLLVLDRKIRDFNALTPKEQEKKLAEEEAKKEAQKVRSEKIKEVIAEVMNSADNGDKPVTDGDVLIKAPVGVDSIVISDGIKKIGKYSFANSTASSITLPDSIRVIEKGAFYGCKKLRSLNLENAVVIEESAFEECENLDDIRLGKALKKIGDGAFEKCARVTISCPKGSYAEKYAYDNYIFCIADEPEKNDKKNKNQNERISVKSFMASARKSKKIKPMLNLNQIVLGGSGTGKSRFLVKPNLMQCNTSFVVTDPSGELLQSCGKMLERMGYEIKVFNINDMSHSSNYNPFCYLNGSDGKYDENNVIKMINTFMLNTKGEGEGGDPFWDDATKLLLSAICFLLVETAPEEQQNFAGVLDLIHKAKVIEGKEEEKSDLDLIFDDHKAEAPDCLSCQYYEEFKQAAGKTMQSILISTTVRLQCFKLEKVRNLTYTDTLHLDEMGDKLTALFIIIPSTDTTYNFLAAMMYTQLFDSLYNRAISKYHGRLPVHVRFLLDEFANVGKIPDFDKVLATCRKFEISVVVILQNLSQLKRLYEKSWEELPGNCDTMIFLGGKDQFTNEHLMKSLGNETIDLVSVNKSKGQSGSTSYNDSILGRELMKLNELETMENSKCIVMVRGLNPFLTDKFEIKNHARYNMLDEAWNYSTMGTVNRNSYIIEDEIQTLPEVKIMDLSEWIDDDEIEAFDADIINVMYVSPDNNQRIYTAEEIKAAEGLDTDMLGDVMCDVISSVTL